MTAFRTSALVATAKVRTAGMVTYRANLKACGEGKTIPICERHRRGRAWGGAGDAPAVAHTRWRMGGRGSHTRLTLTRRTSKLLARTPRPVLAPSPKQRDGYVPNVVYSCGALVVGRDLLLPYAVADSFTAFATTTVDDLLAVME